ncbi:hypothetical protein WJ74_10795 [Burkholderia ubonensis]|uniref:hypothetical protein n=1 Tax=Burkholderia ubonensis TaxID=101571 RepID=UPI000756FEEE|nr:hypothetical protein [Burkholderia ubonensis]KVO15134.1 hypothetical protein WJ74_10795 [Burkholderia ubonensis]
MTLFAVFRMRLRFDFRTIDRITHMASNDIDKELAELGELALRNAFYREYSALVQRYLNASDGLGIGDFESRLGEVSSPFGRADVESTGRVSIAVVTGGEARPCATMRDALAETGDAIQVCGETVFELRESLGWYVAEPPTRRPRPRV